ncbi:DcaP family trimeric outer membrane transporter [uncultured Shewanella sp.]|uniref:DcaP family trimeric outer membrane transporter n=1 Tax=Shewanella atlantica TaxID=271099 RepID=UPI0026279AD6|nr:DcaP family trimeric outer membrane transporter [uncultured Shewanella sp.]
MKALYNLALFATTSLPMCLAQASVPMQSLNDTSFAFGGFTKASFMVSDFSNGAPSDASPARQFYAPGALYGDGSHRGKRVTDFQARESRFNFMASSKLNGHKLKFFTELDFLLHTDGNERISNSYSPRLRHAYIGFDNWTLGQTWTTFVNLHAAPESLDFTGAPEGLVFARNPQLRYTHGNWQFSLENPNSNFTNAVDGTLINSNSDLIPDFIARYNFNNNGSKYTLAALARQLKYDEHGIDETKFAWAASGSGSISVGAGRDKFKFMVNYGEGAGRYLAMQFVNAAVLENGEASTINTISGLATYQHWWSEKLRTNLTVSGFKADYDNLPEVPVNEVSYSGNINLIYSPVPPLSVGIEYLFAHNEKTDGFDGELNRLTFSVKYAI